MLALAPRIPRSCRSLLRVVAILGTLAAALLLLSTSLASDASAANPLDPKVVPEPLKPWTAWALYGKTGAFCPTLLGVGNMQCTWPSRLDLVLDEKRGTFKQSWHVDAQAWVPLPGSDKRWPLDVSIDGKRTVVIPREGVPSVEVDEGDHVISGTFAWDSLPESLQVPAQTALLQLRLREVAIEQPNRDAKGTLWLQKTLAAEASCRGAPHGSVPRR